MRERERERDIYIYAHTYIHTCIYMYTHRNGRKSPRRSPLEARTDDGGLRTRRRALAGGGGAPGQVYRLYVIVIRCLFLGTIFVCYVLCIIRAVS